MKRAEYWGYVVALWVIFFIAGYVFVQIDETLYNLLLLFNLIAMWVLGYHRIKDAGHHGAWAIFTPFLLGTIIIGLLPSKKEVNLL